MTGAWKIEIVRVRLARLPENAEESSHLQLFLRVVLGVTARAAAACSGASCELAE